MILSRRLAPWSVVLGLVFGCGSSDAPAGDGTGTPGDADGGGSDTGPGGITSGSDGGTSPGGEGGTTGGDSGATTTITTIFTVVFENHDYDEVVGSADAPFFNALIAQGALATNYSDSGTHPSLPNYLTLISGAPQYAGILDVDPTNALAGFPKDAPNLATQLESMKIPWRSYQESMGSPCALTASGKYAPKHDPFLYFKDVQGDAALCAKTNVDYTKLAEDLPTLPYRYVFITPNLTSDGHDPVDLFGNASDPVASLKTSDAWAKTEIGDKLMKSQAYLNGGVIFVTWDEAEGRNGHSKDKVPMIILSPRIKMAGMKSDTAYSHKSYLATVEDLLGLPRLDTVKNEASMKEFFR